MGSDLGMESDLGMLLQCESEFDVKEPPTRLQHQRGRVRGERKRGRLGARVSKRHQMREAPTMDDLISRLTRLGAWSQRLSSVALRVCTSRCRIAGDRQPTSSSGAAPGVSACGFSPAYLGCSGLATSKSYRGTNRRLAVVSVRVLVALVRKMGVGVKKTERRGVLNKVPFEAPTTIAPTNDPYSESLEAGPVHCY